MSSLTVNNDDIIRYYDECQEDYELLWQLKSKMSMHYGYWDKDTTNLGDALTNMNHYLASKLELTGDKFILDAGCGVGGSSIYLAKHHHGVKTIGISLSEKQIQNCRLNAKEKEVQNQCSFQVADFTHTGLEDERFDIVWAVESVCHASEKKDFIAEAYRLLKPGGKLIVADFFTVDKTLNNRHQRLMNQWADSWAVPHFEKGMSFNQKMRDQGFDQIEFSDITTFIKPSARRLYYYFIPGILAGTLMKLIGKRTQVLHKNMWSTYYQYSSLTKDLWKYLVFQGIKPKDKQPSSPKLL